MDRVSVNLISYIVLLLLGAGLTLFSALGYLDEFWSGMGIGLIVVSVLNLIRFARYKTDPAYAERISVRNRDERNRYLAEKARSFSFFYSVLAECLAIIVLRVAAHPQLSTAVGFVLCAQLVLYWVSWLCLRRKY